MAKVTFLADDKLVKAFKEYCDSRGQSMTWHFIRCMRETLAQGKPQPMGAAVKAAERRSRSRRKS